MKKQYISWCIILLLVFAYPLAARAALSNVVVGLQNGAGDVVELYGENLELILDARETALYNLNRVFAISIDAAGMWPALKGALQDGYSYALNTTEDVLRAIGYLFGDWITDADLLANNIYEAAAAHCYVSEDGKLYIDGDFVDYVDSFLQWLWSANGGGLINYADTVQTGLSLNGVPVYRLDVGDSIDLYVSSGWTYYYTNASNNDTAILLTTYDVRQEGSGAAYNFFKVFAVADPEKYNGAGDLTLRRKKDSTDESRQTGGVTLTWGMTATNFSPMTNWPLPYTSSRPSGTVSGESVEGGVSYVGNPDIFAGLTSAEIDLSTYFDITATDTPVDGDWTITPKQLVQAVAESIAGDQSDQQITAVDGSGAQTVVAATPTGAELQPVEGSPASGSNNFPTITTPSIDGNWNGVEGFEIDLTGVFPFCIPFDIYKLFQKLAVEPVTPVFEIPVAVLERVGMYETITVDLSPFDDFAASVRTVEKLAILVAVGVMSYKMIFGGD